MKIKLLGDPHLAKPFVQNVPLHRRGERERIVWEKFEEELDPGSADLHVCLGDLFDAPVVPLFAIERAAALYLEAARRHPGAAFLVMPGNHDVSRDLEKVSAFDLFKDIVRGRLENLRAVSEVTRVKDNLVFFPWSPVVSAEEMVSALPYSVPEGVAFGHWDVDLRSDLFNRIPTRALAEKGFTTANTGHVHLPQEFVRDGVNVTVVGSMMPYAHGEDPTGETYVTLSLTKARDAEPDTLRNKCVRVKLQAGEVFDLQIDCLQLQVERVGTPDEEQFEVSLGEFEPQKMFGDVLIDHNVPSVIAAQVRSEWERRFALGA